jgi:hypothetical protein
MPDYQKAKIYKLWSPSKNIIYFGSTTQAISQRLGEHLRKYRAYNNNNTKYYCSSFLVLDCDDYKIELLEEYACNNKTQLCKKEGEYIKNNECINKEVAGRTQKEYYNDNSEKMKEYHKQYYIDNADKIKEQIKQYQKDNKDKISEYDRQRYLKKKLEKE